jgi:hypothetical protein
MPVCQGTRTDLSETKICDSSDSSRSVRSYDEPMTHGRWSSLPPGLPFVTFNSIPRLAPDVDGDPIAWFGPCPGFEERRARHWLRRASSLDSPHLRRLREDPIALEDSRGVRARSRRSGRDRLIPGLYVG